MEFIKDTVKGTLRHNGRTMLRFSTDKITVEENGILSHFFEVLYDNITKWINCSLKRKLIGNIDKTDRRSRLYEKIPTCRFSINIDAADKRYYNVKLCMTLDEKTVQRAFVICGDGTLESPETICGRKAKRYKTNDFSLEKENAVIYSRSGRRKIVMKRIFEN